MIEKKSNGDWKTKEGKSKQKNRGGCLVLDGKTISKSLQSWKWRKLHYAMWRGR